MRVHMLEYDKEVDYGDFETEEYNLIGLYLSEEAAIHLNRPNSRAAPAMFRGFQLPKIMTARARKPKPATSPVEAQLAVVRAYTNPPMPAKAPEMVVPA